MTFEQSIETHLTSNGLFPTQARAIIDEIKNSTDEHAKSVAEMFPQDVDGYPEIMRTVIMISVNSLALEWLNKNAPQHWARPMFMTPEDREEFLPTSEKGAATSIAIGNNNTVAGANGIAIRGNYPGDINN